MKDTRYVYGFCTWHDSIHKAGSTGPQKMMVNGRQITSAGLPCCPMCGSMLCEVSDKKIWDEGVAEHEKMHPGYAAYVKWTQGRCFPNLDAALAAYNRVHGFNKTREDFGF